MRTALAIGVFVLLAGGAAGAQSYRVLDGEVFDAASGAREALSGTVEVGMPGSFISLPVRLEVDRFPIQDFELFAGDAALLPNVPHELGGIAPGLLRVTLYLDDGLALAGDRVALLHLVAGGGVVASDDETVTFRDWSLVGNDGWAVGRVEDGTGAPDRFTVAGTLEAVESTYDIVQFPCTDVGIAAPPVVPATPGRPPSLGGGGITISGDGSTLSLAALAPDAGATIIAVGTSVPFDLRLEDLGIVAIDGAEITVEASGVVTVESAGPIEIDAGALEIEGLTRLVIVSDVSITVGPSGIALPEGVALELSAGGEISVPGPIVRPDPDIVIVPPVCPYLRPVATEVVAQRTFELVAAREVPVELALAGGGRGRGVVRLAIAGSSELDVRDIDPGSLRLAPGGRAPARRGVRRRDLDGDGRDDLVVRFHGAGAASGADELCLTGATWHGPAIAGCVALEAHRGPAQRSRRHGPPPKRGRR